MNHPATTRKTLGLPPIPRTQALSSTTFRPPPLDGSLSIPELYDWHLTNSPDHPLFVFSDENGSATTITWKEVGCAVHRGGHLVQGVVHKTTTARPERIVCAILAYSDTIVYFTLIAAIIRAGHVAFPISPRNSPAAIAHLISETGVICIFVGVEESVQHLADAALRCLSESEKPVPGVAQFPLFADLYQSDPSMPLEILPPLVFEWDDPLVILHSSGSTAFPKPLVYTHERFLLGCLAPWFGERDLTGQRLSCHSMPMYHGMGIMQVGWTAFSGLVLTVFKSQVPTAVPSPDSVMRGAMDTKSDLIFCVPSFVEEWVKQPRSSISLDIEIFGGGPLLREVGDYLTDQGITVFAMYGNSECGINNVILPEHVGKDWEYFAFPANVKPHFIACGDGTAELVLMSHQLQKPCVINIQVDGTGGYATSDLFVPHPTKPGYWKIFGRLDDQIMHNTGEKTNPGPLESILVQDPHIQSAVIFGRGRFNAGVLIDPIPSERFDPDDQQKLVSYRIKIWPSVEKLNEFAPQHSRIFKEMILVSSPSKPFTYTAKHTPCRHAIIQEYEKEIEILYNAVDETMQTDLPSPVTWNFTSVLDYVRTVVHGVLKHALGDSDDMFHFGCDSLQATWMRNTLLHALKGVTNTRLIPDNFVYQHPTISSLAAFISATATSDYSNWNTLGDSQNTKREMLRLVDKYSRDLPLHKPSLAMTCSSKDVVVITGTTGVLGSALLARLVSEEDVERVYALNRKTQDAVTERQRIALQKQHVNADEVLTSSKVIWLEADEAEDNLGLSPGVYEEIRKGVTHIIHNAWRMDFNNSLRSFETNIVAVRRLVDLALSSPRIPVPRLVFCSSAGMLHSKYSDLSQSANETQIEPEIAIGSGYTESKWVSERLLQVILEKSPLRPVIIRIGQLCGSMKSGYWNEAEWFPSLVRSSAFLKCFPTCEKSIALLPVEDAARAICEMRDSDIALLHLEHPHPVKWTSIAKTICAELNVQPVPYDMWYALLKKSGEGLAADEEVEALRKNPALKLMAYFAYANIRADSVQAMGMPKLDMSAARTVSTSLRELEPLPEDIVLEWIQYWRSTDLLE
ncbi:hypothetical protein NM688_g7002 [Phlebia brevispora]|uniref:Uncharacterized protein n=1 Tax=Phlebia brevispora TaxID=194682 RepID=A0ACC1SA48_9APHY|nr:hypothetical protein NM688_g7002 [Phlebia brevispora]